MSFLRIKKTFITAIIFIVLASFFLIFNGRIQDSLKYSTSAIEAKTGSATKGRIIEMRALKDQWTFYPESIDVKKGEHIVLKIYNEDDYMHGFAIESLKINMLLPPEEETVIDFTATKTGSFGFYCSVPCGEGHYRMNGEALIR